jgi:uncharacterized protein with ParB-like and HNH nuclease domain
MRIQTILDQIDLGSMALPEFQRGYVWNGDQVKRLMRSLYLQHPVGSLLVWVTKTESANTRGDGTLAPGSVKLLLDGQQRITSLYGIIKGKPPEFFDGDPKAFTNLFFNLEEEVFEFYAPLKMKDNPLWIDVTNVMKIGSGEAIKNIFAISELHANITLTWTVSMQSTISNRLTFISKTLPARIKRLTWSLIFSIASILVGPSFQRATWH